MKTSQIEIIEQAITFLRRINKESYSNISAPNFSSSVGSHIRHIIDHYQSIISGLNSGLINYNERSRGNSVEREPEVAISKLNSIISWISNISEEEMNRNIKLLTEISISTKKNVEVDSNVKRELIFAGSHAIHHYEIISQIAKNQQTIVNNMPLDTFGVAPATSSYLRENKEKPKECAR